MDTQDDSTISGDAPRDVRRPDVERRLIAAVSRLCADGRPFAEVSVSRLAREAGLARATFYLYFADRSAFALRLVQHVGELLAESVSTMWRAVIDDHDLLASAVSEFIEIYCREYAVIRAVVDSVAGDAAVAAYVEAGMDGFISESAKVIEAAQRRGSLRAGLPVHETVTALIWMVERTCNRLGHEDDPASRARVAQALTAISWHSLHPDAD